MKRIVAFLLSMLMVMIVSGSILTSCSDSGGHTSGGGSSKDDFEYDEEDARDYIMGEWNGTMEVPLLGFLEYPSDKEAFSPYISDEVVELKVSAKFNRSRMEYKVDRDYLIDISHDIYDVLNKACVEMLEDSGEKDFYGKTAQEFADSDFTYREFLNELERGFPFSDEIYEASYVLDDGKLNIYNINTNRNDSYYDYNYYRDDSYYDYNYYRNDSYYDYNYYRNDSYYDYNYYRDDSYYDYNYYRDDDYYDYNSYNNNYYSNQNNDYYSSNNSEAYTFDYEFKNKSTLVLKYDGGKITLKKDKVVIGSNYNYSWTWDEEAY